MNDAQTRFTLEVVVPEAYWPTRETPKVLTLEPGVERTWIRLMQDRTFTPDVQSEMARRIGCERVIDLDAGHMAMISRPKELAAVLNQLHG